MRISLSVVAVSCEPVDVLKYEPEEKEEKKDISNGSTIEDWKVDVDSTVYELKPVNKINFSDLRDLSITKFKFYYPYLLI